MIALTLIATGTVCAMCIKMYRLNFSLQTVIFSFPHDLTYSAFCQSINYSIRLFLTQTNNNKHVNTSN